MELSALIHRARGLVDDRVAPLSARDVDFVEYAKRAVREAAERSLCLRASYELTLEVGVGEYEIPLADTRPESIVVQRVYVNGKPIAKGTAEQMEAWLQENTTQDTPTTFGQRDQTLYLAPLPDEIITITLSGVWYPLAELSMDDPDAEPEIPARLHDDLAHWLAYEAILSGDAGDSREERRTRLAERHLAHFTKRFGPARSARELNHWRELPQERVVRGQGLV
jgi:hypothetical protein